MMRRAQRVLLTLLGGLAACENVSDCMDDPAACTFTYSVDTPRLSRLGTDQLVLKLPGLREAQRGLLEVRLSQGGACSRALSLQGATIDDGRIVIPIPQGTLALFATGRVEVKVLVNGYPIPSETAADGGSASGVSHHTRLYAPPVFKATAGRIDYPESSRRALEVALRQRQVYVLEEVVDAPPYRLLNRYDDKLLGPDPAFPFSRYHFNLNGATVLSKDAVIFTSIDAGQRILTPCDYSKDTCGATLRLTDTSYSLLAADPLGDLVAFVGDKGVSLLRADAASAALTMLAGPQQLLPSPPSQIAVGGLRPGGRSEAALLDANNQWQRLLREADGSYKAPLTVTAVAAPKSDNATAIAIADVDADGLADLVWLSNDSQLHFLAALEEEGKYSAPAAAELPLALTRFALGDLDGQGGLDLVGRADKTVVTLLNSAATTPAATTCP